jgi:hypothetical protein
MNPTDTPGMEKQVEKVVGLFDTPEDASRVAASLRRPELSVQRVSRVDPTAPDQMPKLIFDPIAEIDGDSPSSGILRGGAIGAGSGLLFLGVPGLNVAAPIAGALVGAWIGGIAGIDEANRSIELPDENDYRSMLAAGKSFVVIAGDETTRIEIEKQMTELGAVAVYQHPPVLQAIRPTAPSTE